MTIKKLRGEFDFLPDKCTKAWVPHNCLFYTRTRNYTLHCHTPTWKVLFLNRESQLKINWAAQNSLHSSQESHMLATSKTKIQTLNPSFTSDWHNEGAGAQELSQISEQPQSINSLLKSRSRSQVEIFFQESVNFTKRRHCVIWLEFNILVFGWVIPPCFIE